MPATPKQTESRPYPDGWDQVAEIRVFRTTGGEWQSLIVWRRDMKRKGLKLLKVATRRGEMLAVFGRTRGDLLERERAK